MNNGQSDLMAGYWAKNLDDVAREAARLATICNVKILNPGVIERVLENDASVCGTSNRAAFAKLRSALIMNYHIRGKTAGVIGEANTAKVIEEIVERIKKQTADRLGGASP
jgi:hypothetical protein